MGLMNVRGWRLTLVGGSGNTVSNLSEPRHDVGTDPAGRSNLPPERVVPEQAIEIE
jgi:hypothetical protein